MGDLSGGQIIKKLVPGPTNLYEFEGDVEELKTAVRSKLHLGLEEESKVCFAMVQKFLEELEESVGHMGTTD
jgi:heme oxygenase